MNDEEFKEIIAFLKRNATRGEKRTALVVASRAIGRKDEDILCLQNVYDLFKKDSYRKLTDGQRAVFVALQQQVYARIGSDMELSKQYQQLQRQLA